MRFVQNRAIAFTVTLHDPSEYLSNADITYNWDFGDESGALISRELTVTHTYVDSGSFRPQVVIQAVIQDKACDPPSDRPTTAPGPPTHQVTTGQNHTLPVQTSKNKNLQTEIFQHSIYQSRAEILFYVPTWYHFFHYVKTDSALFSLLTFLEKFTVHLITNIFAIEIHWDLWSPFKNIVPFEICFSIVLCLGL